MCDCIEQMNEGLKAFNAELDVALCMDRKTLQFKPLKVQIQMCKLDTKKRKPLPALPASYCPFCGDRYEWPDPKEMSDEELIAELERANRQRGQLHERWLAFWSEWVRRQDEANP